MLTSDSVVVAGGLGPDVSPTVVLARFDPDSGASIDTHRDLVGGAFAAASVAVAPGGALVLGGSGPGVGGSSRGFVARVAPNNALSWIRIHDTLSDDAIEGVATVGEVVVAAGHRGNDAITVTYAADGTELAERLHTPTGESTESASGRWSVVAAQGDSVIVVGSATSGRRGDQVWVRRLALDGATLDELLHPPFARGLAVATLGTDDVFVGGESAGAGWLAQLGEDGGFSQTTTVESTEAVTGVAGLESGGLVAVGTTGTSSWVLAFGPDGTETWATSLKDTVVTAVAVDEDTAYVTGSVGASGDPRVFVAAFSR